MQNLTRHYLDFDKAYTYFKEHVDFELTLTDLILKEVDFSHGRFFTELPENANIEKLYSFPGGGIIPSSKENWRFIESLNTYGYFFSNLRMEMAEFYQQYLQKKTDNYVLLDECLLNKKDAHDSIYISSVQTVFQELEVYYLLKHSNTISETFSATKAHHHAWHSLAVLSSGSLKDSEHFITDNQKVILENIEYLVCGAYDGQAYMFWEKNK